MKKRKPYARPTFVTFKQGTRAEVIAMQGRASDAYDALRAAYLALDEVEAWRRSETLEYVSQQRHASWQSALARLEYTMLYLPRMVAAEDIEAGFWDLD